MRKTLLILLLLTPVLAHTQEGMQQGMNPELMQQLQEVMACVAAVDKTEMNTMEKGAKKIQEKVKDLCKNGKREQAQKQMVDYSKEMMKSPAFIRMRKCTENMPAALKGVVPDMSSESIAKELKNKNICDEI